MSVSVTMVNYMCSTCGFIHGVPAEPYKGTAPCPKCLEQRNKTLVDEKWKLFTEKSELEMKVYRLERRLRKLRNK